MSERPVSILRGAQPRDSAHSNVRSPRHTPWPVSAAANAPPHDTTPAHAPTNTVVTDLQRAPRITAAHSGPLDGEPSSAGAPLGAGYLTGEAYRAHAEAIARELHRSREAHSFERPELRESVARCAAQARAAGCPPERLLVALKELVSDGALATINEWFRRVMTERVVAWAIAAYYEIDRSNATDGRSGVD